MGEKYFNVVRVYGLDNKYDFLHFSSEFVDMVSYDEWIQLRENKLILEVLDVFILTDINKLDIDEIKNKLYKFKSDYRSKELEVEEKYNKSKSPTKNFDKVNELKSIYEDIRNQFSSYLTSTYNKLNIDE